jgi:hypothetical protein
MFTPTCFDISVSSSRIFNNLRLAKLSKFLILRLLKLQLRKILDWNILKCYGIVILTALILRTYVI